VDEARQNSIAAPEQEIEEIGRKDLLIAASPCQSRHPGYPQPTSLSTDPRLRVEKRADYPGHSPEPSHVRLRPVQLSRPPAQRPALPGVPAPAALSAGLYELAAGATDPQRADAEDEIYYVVRPGRHPHRR